MTRTVRSQQNDTLDRLCQRYLGTTAGVTEQALTLNPGLAELGPLLPQGTVVRLPQRAPPSTRPTVNLWD